MAEGAGFVAIDRKLLIIKHGFAEQFDLLNLVARRSGEAIDGLCLDMIDLALDHGYFFKDLRRQKSCGRFWRRIDCASTPTGNNEINNHACQECARGKRLLHPYLARRA
jgi:hypothetical protein